MNNHQKAKIIPLPVQSSGNLKGLIFEDNTSTQEMPKARPDRGIVFSLLIPLGLLLTLVMLLNLAIKPGLTNQQLKELDSTKTELQRIKTCLR